MIFQNRLTRGAVALIAFAFAASAADTSGKVLGTVKDPAGNFIPHATATLVNKATGAKQATQSDDQGGFAFPVVPVGLYELMVSIENFRPYRKSDIAVDLGSAVQLEVRLDLVGVSESVTVTEDATQVETSDTKLGQVIESKQVTGLPLNGRSYTDLLAIQGGVTPITTGGAVNSTSGGGFGSVPVAGNADTGQFSINGQRESANGFYLNGASVQEAIGQQAGIIPNLDSIAEFRIITSNADAEYGGFSGGVVNVITKSGGNEFHGSGFEFLRNTDLDARGFFSPERSAFQQNQFGGTLGGPIRKNKLFFFVDYQGQRTIQGIETGLVQVPSLANREGNFSDCNQYSDGRCQRRLSGANAFEPPGLWRDSGRAVLHAQLHFHGPVCLPEGDHPTASVFRTCNPTTAIHTNSQRWDQYIFLRCRKESSQR